MIYIETFCKIYTRRINTVINFNKARKVKKGKKKKELHKHDLLQGVPSFVIFINI